MLLSVDTFDNKKELMNVCIDMAEMNKKDNSVFMEFGVYQGESINYMAERTKLQIYGFDSFEGIPNNWRSGFGKGHFNISTVPKDKFLRQLCETDMTINERKQIIWTE